MRFSRWVLIKKLYERDLHIPSTFLTSPVSGSSVCVSSHRISSQFLANSRLLQIGLVVQNGRTEASTDRGNLSAWAAGMSIAAMGLLTLEDCRSSEIALCDAAEQTLPSPMGKTPASKLTTPTYYLGDAYRRRVFFNYERRLRMRSPPEKVFEYFSSVRGEHGQTFMSAADLMRAVVPVFPPTGSNIVREGHLGGERSPGELKCPPSKFFMLFDTNGDGLISFSEYIFFVTLLSIPEKNFSAAFRMFDLDGNGVIDKNEFKKVMTWMRAQTRQGAAQTNGLRTGLKVAGDVENGGVVEFFFGEDGKRELPHEEFEKFLRELHEELMELPHEEFEKFLRELHEEIIRLEFVHYDWENSGTISATDFGLSMAAAAELSKLHNYLDRVHDLSKDPHFASMRITLEEFVQFSKLRKKLPMMSLAISSFGKIQGLLTKQDLQRAAAKICGTPVSDAVVDIIFHIFDTNGDGNLSTEEFLGVLQRRERDIEDPTETGFIHFLKCMWKCTSNCQKPWFV